MHRLLRFWDVARPGLQGSARLAAAGAAVALLVACGATRSTASRSAAAFDEAQRKSDPVGGADAHGAHQHPESPEAAASPASPDHAAMGHETSPSDAGAVDHSSMGHGAVATVAQRQAASAEPGAPAVTLAPDALDGPAATAVEEAQRAGQMAGGGHGRHGGHGAPPYRQIDAGKVPDAAASGHGAGTAPPPPHPPKERP